MQEQDNVNNTQDPNQVQGKTDLQFIEQMQNVYREIGTLEEDLKQIKDDAKERGYDPALLSKVAKATVNYKAQDIIDKNTEFATLVYKVEDGE